MGAFVTLPVRRARTRRRPRGCRRSFGPHRPPSHHGTRSADHLPPRCICRHGSFASSKLLASQRYGVEFYAGMCVQMRGNPSPSYIHPPCDRVRNPKLSNARNPLTSGAGRRPRLFRRPEGDQGRLLFRPRASGLFRPGRSGVWSRSSPRGARHHRPSMSPSLCSPAATAVPGPLGVQSAALSCSRSLSPSVPADALRLLNPLAGLVHRSLPGGGHRSEPSSDRAISLHACPRWPAVRVAICWPAFAPYGFRLPGRSHGRPRRSEQRASDGA